MWTLVALLALELSGAPETVACPTFSTPEVPESSGLVESRRFPGLFWTHNDSGDRARIFAVKATGEVVKEVAIEGARNVDWEAIAIDGDGFLYVADSGDNDNVRRDLRIYRLPEPDPHGPVTRVRADRVIRFRYPGRVRIPDPEHFNFDAEALFFAQGTLFLLNKHRSDTRTDLFRFPSLSGTDEVVLEPVGSFDVGGAELKYGGMVTGADLSADGRYLAVLSYHAIFVFERVEGTPNYLSKLIRQIPVDQKHAVQAEGIAWKGRSLLLTDERGHLHWIEDPFSATKYPLPKAIEATARPGKAARSPVD